jgi:hypothetical protein
MIQFDQTIKTRRHTTHMITSQFLVTNQSVKTVTGCHQIICFATSYNATFSVSGVKRSVT